MKIIIPFILFLSITSYNLVAQNQAIIRFNGVYRSKVYKIVGEKDSIISNFSYLRFYQDDTVLSVSTAPSVKPKDLKRWFNKEKYTKKYDSKGVYEIKQNKIHFNSTDSEFGSVLYDGKILNKNTMILEATSLINGNKSTVTYYFLKMR